MSCLRISIGALDLSSATFSYDDLPAGEIDPGLDRFELEAGPLLARK
jgi:glucosylceramidase